MTGNGGADTFNFADDASTSAKMTAITDFELGAGNDVIKFTDGAATYEALTAASKTALGNATTLTEALEAVNDQLGEHEATAFVFDGNAYVMYEEVTNGANFGTNEDDYTVVKLQGVTDVSAFDSTQIG